MGGLDMIGLSGIISGGAFAMAESLSHCGAAFAHITGTILSLF